MIVLLTPFRHNDANEEDDDDYIAIVYQAYSALLLSTNVTVPYRT